MKKSQFTEEQIAYALHEVEVGTPVAEICRKLGVSEQTFYRWKKKFAGMGIAELRRLKQLEAENRKLKQLVADLSLDKHMLQEVIRKKTVKPAQKRDLVQFLCVGFKVSERRACQAIGIQRSSYRYTSTAEDQTALQMRIRDLAAVRVRYGYRRLHVLLRREGWQVNHKRVYRLYRQEGLSLRLKTRKKRISATRMPPSLPATPNQRWRMDFMSDSLYDGCRFRVLTLVDNMTRERPALVVNRSFSGQAVAEVLDRLAQTTGLPQVIQVDNGPEFASKALDEWADRHQVKLAFSRPGTPTDNPFIEAFNGRFRQECLDQNWFASLHDACIIIEAWRKDYNTVRPHTALDHLTPAAYKEQWFQQQRLSENG